MRPRWISAPLAIAAALCLGAAAAQTARAPVTGDFTLAAGGDLLGYYQPLTTLADPELRKVSKLLRDADAGFANREGNVFDLGAFKGSPSSETGGFSMMDVGGGPLATASTAADMKLFGLNLMSLANNHSMDWGEEGLFATEHALDAAGIARSGTGRSRQAARAPGYLQTRGGRIALVATASTFLPSFVAGPGSAERGPRPGISALRTTPVTLVSEAEMVALKAIAARQGRTALAAQEVTIGPNSALLNDQRFRVADRPGVDYEVNATDRRELMAAIGAAKREADYAVFSIHAHETDSGGQEHEAPPESLRPANFLRPLFHDAVDAGADAVFTHGPHTLRGIEIYKGKPIFYGLGSLFFEISVPGYAWPAGWYDSVLAVNTFKGGRISEIRLYPLVLRREGEAPLQSLVGSPRLATGADARRILAALQRESAPYGTRIEVVGDVGVIRPDAKP